MSSLGASRRFFRHFRNFLVMLLLGTEILPSELEITDLPTQAVLWLNAAEYEMALQNSARPGKQEW